MYCNFCGKQIQDDAVHCAYCGRTVGYAAARPQKLIRPPKGSPDRKSQGSVPDLHSTLTWMSRWCGSSG